MKSLPVKIWSFSLYGQLFLNGCPLGPILQTIFEHVSACQNRVSNFYFLIQKCFCLSISLICFALLSWICFYSIKDCNTHCSSVLMLNLFFLYSLLLLFATMCSVLIFYLSTFHTFFSKKCSLLFFSLTIFLHFFNTECSLFIFCLSVRLSFEVLLLAQNGILQYYGHVERKKLKSTVVQKILNFYFYIKQNIFQLYI